MKKIIIVGCIALWLASLVAINGLVDKEFQNEVSVYLDEARRIHEQVKDKVWQVESDLYDLYNNKDLQKYLNETNTREDIETHENYDKVKALLERTASENGYMFAWIANDRGNFFLDNTHFMSPEDYDTTKRPWYHKAIEVKDIYYSDPYMDVGTGSLLMTATKVLKDVPYSFVSLDFSISSMLESIESQYILMDEDGMIILNNNLEYMQGTAIYEYDLIDHDALDYDDATIITNDRLTVVSSTMGKYLVYTKDLREIYDESKNRQIVLSLVSSLIAIVFIAISIFSRKKTIEE